MAECINPEFEETFNQKFNEEIDEYDITAETPTPKESSNSLDIESMVDEFSSEIEQIVGNMTFYDEDFIKTILIIDKQPYIYIAYKRILIAKGYHL